MNKHDFNNLDINILAKNLNQEIESFDTAIKIVNDHIKNFESQLSNLNSRRALMVHLFDIIDDYHIVNNINNPNQRYDHGQDEGFEPFNVNEYHERKKQEELEAEHQRLHLEYLESEAYKEQQEKYLIDGQKTYESEYEDQSETEAKYLQYAEADQAYLNQREQALQIESLTSALNDSVNQIIELKHQAIQHVKRIKKLEAKINDDRFIEDPNAPNECMNQYFIDQENGENE